MGTFRTLALALALGAALIASGCGGSSSAGSSSGGAATTTPSTSSGGGDASSFCDTAKSEMNGLSDQLAPLTSGQSSPETIQQKLDKIEQAYQKVIASAPDEIKGDLETMLAALDKLKAAYSSTSDPTTAMAQLLPILNDQKLQAAADHLSQWGSTHCGM
jgi:hypothetical protein